MDSGISGNPIGNLMPNATLPTVLRHLRQLLGRTETSGLTDGQLLKRFIARRDQAAFTTLLERHGGMVLAVCRRLLDHHDAEDVFQATFLVLVKKAMSIRKHQSVGSWLHGVAYRLAAKARAQAALRRHHERKAAELPDTAVSSEIAWRELQQILDEELQRLPDRYRLPLVHCYLEEQTHEEAANALGLPVGTVKSRLARGKERLRKRLAKRGMTLSGLAVTTLLAVNGATSAGLPLLLSQATSQAAGLVGAGQSLAGVVSGQVLALVEGAITAMAASKRRIGLFVLVLGVLLAGGGAAAVAWSASGHHVGEPRDAPPMERARPEKPAPEAEKVTVHKKPAEKAWRLLIPGKLVAVHIERCLYEIKGEKCFFMAIRLSNLTREEIGVDWHGREPGLYVNQWGVHDAERRHIIDERRVIHTPPDREKVRDDFKAGGLLRIPPRKATRVWAEFNASSRADVDKSQGQFFIASLDGQFSATDGNTVDVISLQWKEPIGHGVTDVVLPLPVTWKTKEKEPNPAVLRSEPMEKVPAEEAWLYDHSGVELPRKVAKEKFDKVRYGMTLEEMVKLLGKAWMRPNSSIRDIYWGCEDGRVIQIYPAHYRRDEKITRKGNEDGLSALIMYRERGGKVVETITLPVEGAERNIEKWEGIECFVTRDARWPDRPIIGLDFIGCHLKDADLKKLASVKKSLKSVNLRYNTKLTNAGMKELAPLISLEILYLVETNIGDAGLKELAPLKKLSSLGLDGTRVTDQGLKELARFPNLTHLRLGSPTITDRGLKEIASLTNLQELYLAQANIGDAGVKELASLKNLKHLGLDVTKVSDAGLRHLANLKDLEYLGLAHTQVTGSAFIELAGLKKLTKVNLYGSTASDEGLKGLASLKNLEDLALPHTKITDAGLKELSSLTNLRHLNVAETGVTATGVKDLQAVLPKCKIDAPR
jgi:RNA polymerase sigma factor (sigma-70 family)